MTRRPSSWLYRVAAVLHPVSFALYLGSLAMYVAEVHRSFQVFGVGRTESEAMRLLTTIRELYQDGDVGLAVIITAFTLVFPISKYLALTYVLVARSRLARDRVLAWIKNLGQWSMGDVFVVALLVVVVRVNNSIAQIQVDVLAGLWVFAASVISSMVVSALLGFHFSGLERAKAAVATVASIPQDSPSRQTEPAQASVGDG